MGIDTNVVIGSGVIIDKNIKTILSKLYSDENVINDYYGSIIVSKISEFIKTYSLNENQLKHLEVYVYRDDYNRNSHTFICINSKKILNTKTGTSLGYGDFIDESYEDCVYKYNTNENDINIFKLFLKYISNDSNGIDLNKLNYYVFVYQN